MTTIYLAGPVFTLAEREFNRRLADELIEHRKDVEVILPQERAKKLLAEENGLELIFRDCLEIIERCDVVISILDGPDADSGTCIELGYAYARKIPIIGVRTDFRLSEDRGLNLMVSHVCQHLIRSNPDTTADLAHSILESMISAKLII